MPFNIGDRARLTDALLLDIRADEPIGYLQTLMNDLERRSPDRITKIQALLDKIEALQELEDDISPNTIDESGVASRESYLEGAESYHTNAQAIRDNTRREKLGGFRQDIRRYLDPHGYLARVKGVGRAIDGA
ncbi:MAG: hypothetical protein ACRCYP_00945 [Alphaproteobacteria bacterium]